MQKQMSFMEDEFQQVEEEMMSQQMNPTSANDYWIQNLEDLHTS